MQSADSDELPLATLDYELEPHSLTLQADRIIAMRVQVQAEPSAEQSNERIALRNIRISMDLARWVTIIAAHRPGDREAGLMEDLSAGAVGCLTLRLLVSAAVAVPREGHLGLGRLKVLADCAHGHEMLMLRMLVRIPIDNAAEGTAARRRGSALPH